MADNPKASWPKTLDGTIDWEIVFEDPLNGLVPLVQQAQSTDTLRLSAEIIIQKLFTRKNDAAPRAQLMTRLNDIITAGGEQDAIKAQVVALMREVKDERIEKARIYVERNRAGAAIDRRAGLFWKIDTLLKPAVLLPVGGILVLALAAVVYIALNAVVRPDMTAAVGTETVQIESSGESTGAPDQITIVGQPPRAVGQPIPIWLKTVRWPVSPEDEGGDRPQYYAVIPYVMEWPQQIEFCRRVPKVMDTIYVVFSDTMPVGRPPRIDEITALENQLLEEFNSKMPDDFIIKVVLARYGTADFKVSTLPPFCKSPKGSEQ